MHADALDIRMIRRDELHLIRDFPPQEWSLDLEHVYRRHYGREYFYPVVATLGTAIAGTGITMINNDVAWLGTIIVPEQYRKMGIGRAVTEHLIAHARGRGAETILLTASELGQPIYEKIGFQRDIDYVFYKSAPSVPVASLSPKIGPIAEVDIGTIMALDVAATGEHRESMLLSMLEHGVVYRDDMLRGYYLPEFGKGLIVAETDTAGIELLKYRFSRDTTSICVPETNTAARALFTSLGLIQYRSIPRMFLHENIQWQPAMIYSRGTGYCG